MLGQIFERTGLTIITAFFILALSGCSEDGSPTYSLVPTGQGFTQSTSSLNNEIDVLWVVDNSPSMSPLQQNMVNNFSSFISNFQTKGYDFKMAVTTTDAYLSLANFSNNSSYAEFKDGVGTTHTGIFIMTPSTPNLDSVFVTDATQGANGSGDERAFSSFKEALSLSQNSGFVRPTSFFAIVILSDEDDFSDETRCEYCGIDHNYSDPNLDSVSSYETYLDKLTGTTGASRRYNVNAIAVLDSTCLSQHQSASPSTIIGQRYIQMANDTNGVLGSICDTSYATALAKIQSRIASLSTQFFLNQQPDPSTILVTVNGATMPEDPNNGWQYNSTANSIQFFGSAVPPQGAAIQVYFQPLNVH